MDSNSYIGPTHACAGPECPGKEHEQTRAAKAVAPSDTVSGFGYETKDSGERAQFSSGMVRDTDNGKLRWELIYDGPLIPRYAGLLTRGAVKYEARNWLLAEGQAELERFKSSAARHFAQWIMGAKDEDHAAAVVFNMNGAEYVKERMK